MSDKEIVIEEIRQVPELASSQENAAEIAILAAIQKGERDADADRMVAHGHVKKRLIRLISNGA
jgi:hypothetical protein